ncbi:MAG: eat [Bacteroidetes bacterium]|nr:eat [Bacteroidota bacterium]
MQFVFTIPYFPIVQENNQGLSKSLTPLLLWGLGVGYVISGMYVGWNLGLQKGGTLGLAIATFFTIIMYSAFSFSYSELACAIPKAGGAFDYAQRALGRDIGFVTGLAQIIEFVFAPPAIAIGIGTYLHLEFPQLDIKVAAVGVYILFTALNIYGVKAAATFELVITVLAVGELLLFAGVTIPHVQMANLTKNSFPNGWAGAFAALPFAIWFFLGIEGVANVAEETKNPQKDILKGFGWALVTLIILCIITFVAAVGVSGWEDIVYPNLTDLTKTSDAPLPLAMSHVVATDNILYKILIRVGLCGLVASFHGLILASGRATFEFGRVGFAPRFLGKISKRFQTPAIALICNSCIGIIALLTGRTDDIITLSVLGALVLYIVSMVSIIKLRRSEPELVRPFRVPFFPATPIIALVIAVVSFIAVVGYNLKLSGIFVGIILAAYFIFRLFKPQPLAHE